MTLRTSRRGFIGAVGAGALGATVVGTVGVAGGGKPGSGGLEPVFDDYDPAEGELPENVAIDRRGVKYVCFPPRGEIRRITPDNESQTTFATFEVGDGDFGVTGLEVDPRGTLFACLISSSESTNGVWRIERDGTKSAFIPLPVGTFPNDLLLYGGGLLVTDSITGGVWHVRDGSATPWIVDDLLAGDGSTGIGFPIGANGIARTKDGTVYVANTEKGSIVRVPVDPDGSAGTPETFLAESTLVGPDGLAVDTRDDLYAALILDSKVVRVRTDGTVEELATAADGLENSSDVTFGTSRGEQTELFITNYSVLALNNPSLMKLDVGVPGAPIHR